MATHTTVTCDVEGCENEDAKELTLTVVFITEQTEGYPKKPSLNREKIEICDECLQYSIDNREMLTGAGAQGYNKFWFKSKKEKK